MTVAEDTISQRSFLPVLARRWHIWRTVMAMFFQDGLVYKANAIIWILTDVTTAVVMPLIWLASYNGRASIHGFSPSQMVVYYIGMLALTGFIESHVMWDMANDVKQGRFNIYLIRPYSLLSYMYAANLGWRIMRTILVLPLLLLIGLAFRHYLAFHGTLYFGPLLWLAVLGGHFVSFVFSYALGLLSLWLYEVRSVYNFYYLPLILFSGQIAPLALLPSALRTFINWTPFPYMLSFPTNLLLGRLSSAEIMASFLGQILWIGLSLWAALVLWRGGLRRYTAFGI